MRASRFASLPFLLGASALLAVPGNGAAQEAEHDQKVEVVVANNAFQDMHVYWVQSGVLHSLGMVTGLSKQTFTLPRRVAEAGQELYLLADPIGGFGSYLSERLMVSQVDEIDLTIQNNLDLSNVMVRQVS